MKRILWVLPLLALTGCASSAAVARVDVTENPDAVADCQRLGHVSYHPVHIPGAYFQWENSDETDALQEQTAKMGGNMVLTTGRHQSGDAYLCPEAK